MNDELVVNELGKQAKCITDHPGFNAICLNIWALQLSAGLYQTRDGTRYRKKALEQVKVNIDFVNDGKPMIEFLFDQRKICQSMRIV